MAPRILLALLLSIALATPLFAREQREQQRIDYLLNAIGSLQNSVFIRNGKEYDAKAAQDHLCGKLNYGGEKIKTAEQFIEYCATKSSMSGQAYQIRLADGKTVASADWLHEQLVAFDKKR